MILLTGLNQDLYPISTSETALVKVTKHVHIRANLCLFDLTAAFVAADHSLQLHVIGIKGTQSAWQKVIFSSVCFFPLHHCQSWCYTGLCTRSNYFLYMLPLDTVIREHAIKLHFTQMILRYIYPCNKMRQSVSWTTNMS